MGPGRQRIVQHSRLQPSTPSSLAWCRPDDRISPPVRVSDDRGVVALVFVKPSACLATARERDQAL